MNKVTAIFILMSMTVICWAEGDLTQLKIATWNIEWLNREDKRGRVKRDKDDFRALQHYAEILDADIVALQEVDGEAAASRVFNPNEYFFYFSDRKGLQRVGFAIKKDIDFIGLEDVEALALGRARLRHGVQIEVTHNNKTLRIMAVHLKSGCFTKDIAADEPTKSCQDLRDQLVILEDWIDRQARAEQPFIVLGDFNHRFDELDIFWNEINDGIPFNSYLIDHAMERISECGNGKYPQFIDHIILDRHSAAFYVEDSFEQLVYAYPYSRYRLSDHCPISVKLRLSS